MNRREATPQPLVAVIDADASSRRLIQLLLVARGFRVAEHDSAQAALSRWHRHEAPEVCVLDLGLADLAPLELLKKLRDLSPELCAVALTPRRDPMLAAQAMREGAYDHLARPLEPDRMVQAVARASEHHRLIARLRALEQQLVSQPGSIGGPITPLDLLEQREIARALRVTNGSVGKAAKLLGLSRATLYRRLSGTTLA
jgi:DNA-binding NtrC family response regulator